MLSLSMSATELKSVGARGRRLALLVVAGLAAMISARQSCAIEVRVEPLAEAAPAETAPEIAALLAPSGWKVISGKNRTVCEIWPCKEWAVVKDFKPSGSVLYPFEMGQLMGVVRYKRKGGDFRGQEIPAGLYVLRYALQPEDGNHVGTSKTRDFMLLTPAAEDKSAAALDKVALFKLSKKAVGTPHPGMLCLLAPPADVKDLPKIEHEAARELSAVVFEVASQGSEPAAKVAVSLVVIGKAGE